MENSQEISDETYQVNAMLAEVQEARGNMRASQKYNYCMMARNYLHGASPQNVSTINKILDLVNEECERDFQAAFDRVNVRLMVQKFEQMEEEIALRRRNARNDRKSKSCCNLL